MTKSIDELKSELKEFIRERDWEQFHSPKNLAVGLSVEASELLEIFTWLTDEESKNVNSDKLSMVKDEIGDIFIYLLDFCSTVGIDPIECAHKKLQKNAKKYPIAKAKGNATKYSEL
ncbi:MAG: nucleotide pyrophosphohydrolase [Candidatus Marinimicrobia bacterium]|nr:nucleotide pyrophosphohydrolase [Candidatus Brocadiales bacterium]MBL7046542.1 nucleotide pyrophosphohydrolase [Candidatus Neomarinimicrobiota bacterium]